MSKRTGTVIVEPPLHATEGVAIKDPAVGHRHRLLERFERNGGESLHPHEIVELLLTYAIARRDTKPMAHALLSRFKTIGALLGAPREEIVKTAGIGDRSALLFGLVRTLMTHCLREKYERQIYVKHKKDVEEYLRLNFGHLRDEYVALLCLGNRHQIIETVLLAQGTVNQCVVYPRTVIEHALRYGAAALILAHNHPGGSAAPSEADWMLTTRCHTLCALMDIPLLDHLIVFHSGVVSLKELPRWPATPVK